MERTDQVILKMIRSVLTANSDSRSSRLKLRFVYLRSPETVTLQSHPNFISGIRFDRNVSGLNHMGNVVMLTTKNLLECAMTFKTLHLHSILFLEIKHYLAFDLVVVVVDGSG